MPAQRRIGERRVLGCRDGARATLQTNGAPAEQSVEEQKRRGRRLPAIAEARKLSRLARLTHGAHSPISKRNLSILAELSGKYNESICLTAPSVSPSLWVKSIKTPMTGRCCSMWSGDQPERPQGCGSPGFNKEGEEREIARI